MKLNYKTLMIGILCFSAFGLTDPARADRTSELRAEQRQLNAALREWNSRCEGIHMNTDPNWPQCKQDGDKLDAWRASLAARFKAAHLTP